MRGTKIDARIRYDNSESNPNNPSDPPKRVRWGQQSEEEMGSITLLLIAKDERDRRELQQAIRSHSRQSMSGQGAVSGFTSAILSRIKMMDANQDGKIDQSEMPRQFRRWVDSIDTNGDGVLDEQELEAASDGPLRRGRRNRRDR